MNFPTVRHAAVVVPDLTRPFDHARHLTAIAARLTANEVDVFVGLGLHRALSAHEMAPLIATCQTLGWRLHQSDPDAPDAIWLDRERGVAYPPALVAADLRICAGVVEPHQYAGYSGGAKGIAVGCGRREAISRVHGLRLLADPGTRIGNLVQNPFQDELWAMVAGLGDIWGYFVVPGADVHLGPVHAAFETAVAQARDQHFLDVAQPVDWIRLVVPTAKASNFYQASRAATYAALVPRPAVKPGGWLLVDAACPEGTGTGSGEQAFVRAAARGRSQLLDELRGCDRATLGGEQRAYVLARALEHARIAAISPTPMPELGSLGIETFANFEAARAALDLSGPGLTIENPFHQVPRLQ